ncbi:hypothetical protein HQ489_04395 [Candidatus Woesearchaeota archaeon]|nr:hypothetical protein [Candidatus Woesearchaeota archaeon]
MSHELKITKKTSLEAILIAARRLELKLKKELNYDKEIKKVLENSEIEIKNKISVLIFDKKLTIENIEKIYKNSINNNGSSFFLEGSDNYTLITQDKMVKKILLFTEKNVIKHHQNLTLVNIKNPPEVEEIPGIVAFLTSLFSENGVNIIELLSCWKDTLFIFNSKDVNKVINFLQF